MLKHHIVFPFLFSLILFSSLLAQNSLQYPHVHQFIQQMEKMRFETTREYFSGAPTANQAQYDVTSYTLNLKLYPDIQHLAGAVAIQGKSLVNGLSEVELNFTNALTVDSVREGNTLLPFTHNNELLSVTLPTPLNQNENFTIQVFYGGNPAVSGYSSWGWNEHAGQPIIWTLSEPYGARGWWPCKDHPKDKADSVFLNITVPDTLVVASNGILTGTATPDTGWITFSWETHYPISTYLVSLAISNYKQFQDVYVNSTNDSMEVNFFVYPEHFAAAQIDFNNTVDMISYFASVFGEYPFLNEKYGIAIFPWGGGMEHQTITSIGDMLITGNHYYDLLFAHELAHQWFGDAITLRSWQHLWLNEGFASYAEALWTEHLFGFSGYQNYMQSQDPGVFQGSVFVYDTTANMFTNTVYNKGAWVLHMLRGMLGDSLFFTTLRTYMTNFAYSTATTEDFRDVCETVSGWDLDWFFDEWVYGSGRPNYVYNWTVSGSSAPYTTTLNLIQNNPTPFKMPLQIQLIGSNLDTLITVWDSLTTQQFQFTTDQAPTMVLIDPNNWVLKHLIEGDLHTISGMVIDAADSSGLSGAVVYWEGPYDPTTGMPLNSGMDTTDAAGNFQLQMVNGDYFLSAFYPNYLFSEGTFLHVEADTSGIIIALTQPQVAIIPDSLYIQLQDNEILDTTLTIQNVGSGTLYAQAVEGIIPFSKSPGNAFSPISILRKQISVKELLRKHPLPPSRQNAPVDSLWQHIYEDPQENPNNVFDSKDIFVQQSSNMIYFRFTTYQTPPTFNLYRINLFLDTDNDSTTGASVGGNLGVDYLIVVGDFGYGYYGYILEWDEISQNFVFLGMVQDFAVSYPLHAVTFGVPSGVLGNPMILKMFATTFNPMDIIATVDYLPARNLGFLVASLFDVPWLSIDPLFALVGTEHGDSLTLHISPGQLPPGSFTSGITIYATSVYGMEQRIIPVVLEHVTGISSSPVAVPGKFVLFPNYPNPFNPTTTIRYGLPHAAQVRLVVYNILGQRVATLVNRRQKAGYHSVVFDASALSSGIYFYELQAGSFRQIRKMVLMK